MASIRSLSQPYSRETASSGHPCQLGKSAYHGWVYGYSLHLTCNQAGFPKLVQVETASLDESHILEQKSALIFQLDSQALIADNAYHKAIRIRN